MFFLKHRYFIILLAGVAMASALIVFLSPWKALLIMVFFIGALAAIFRPEAILFFLALFLPLEPFLLKFVPDEIYVYVRFASEILIYVLLGIVFLRMFFRKKRFVFTPIDPYFAGLLLLLGISILANQVSISTGALGVRQIIRFILLFYAVAYLAPSKAFMKKLAIAMLALVFLESLLGIAQAVSGGALDAFLLPSERKFYGGIQLKSAIVQYWESGQRVFATLGRYDQFGMFLSFFLLLTVGWLWSVRRFRNKRFFLAVLAAGLPALALTYSRASWFGFAIGFFIIGIFIKKSRRAALALLATSIFLTGYVFVSGVVVKNLLDLPNQTVTERFFEAFSYERWRGEYYGLGRLYFAVKTLTIVFPHSPLFGVGPGSYGGGAAAALRNTKAYEELGLPFGVYGTEGYIDSNWFSLLGETGVLGVLLYAGMFLVLARTSFRLYQKSDDPFAKGMALGYMGCLGAAAFQAFLGQHLESRTLAAYLWMFGGFIVVLEQKEEKKGAV